MFWHNFKYSLKVLFRNKMLIFWTFMFPIVLSLFFNMAFSDIEKNEQLDIINIAIIDTKEFNENILMKEAFKSLGDKSSRNRLFNIKYVSEKEAIKLLDKKEIIGYYLLTDEEKIVIDQNGINATIFEYVIDEIKENTKLIENITISEMQKNPTVDISAIYNQALEIIQNSDANIKDISNKNMSYTMIEYYTLIAMACLYGGILGMFSINQCLANMSHKGKRMSVTAISKGKMILSSVLASYTTQVIGLSLLLLFLYFGIKVDFGNNFWYVVLLSLVGSLAGLSLGVMLSCALKTNENSKTGIIIAVTMLWCFLSGMMGITMKYTVDKNIPFINWINPASMITDGFYALYYYEKMNRFIFDIGSLLVFSTILIIISYIILRRQTYDNI